MSFSTKCTTKLRFLEKEFLKLIIRSHFFKFHNIECFFLIPDLYVDKKRGKLLFNHIKKRIG